VNFRYIALIGALAAWAGCSTSNSEHARLVAQADVVNAGAPLTLAAINRAVVTDTTDDFIPIELATVTLSARPLSSSMVITPAGPYSTFIVTSYDLVWHPGSGAPAALTDYNVFGAGLTAMVPVNSQTVVSVLVGPPAMKSEPWFVGLIGGAELPFTASLDINFHGHDSGSTHEITVSTSTTVIFVGEVFN